MIEYFESNYGPGIFELVLVKDVAAKGALDEVVKGLSFFCAVVPYGTCTANTVQGAMESSRLLQTLVSRQTLRLCFLRACRW